MKRYFLLTSVLALAACGGGSGGGGVAINGAQDFVRSGTVVTNDAKSSNSALTSMTSAIVIAKDGSGSAVVRAAKTFNGKEYEVYTLNDVNFYIAQDPEHASFQFNIDENGRVSEVTENIGGMSDTIQRIGDGTKFSGPMFEYVKEGSDNAKWRVLDDGNITLADLNQIAEDEGLTGGHWNRIDEVLDIKTFGRDQGLQFSDFGHFNPVYRTKNKELSSDELIAGARLGTLNRGSDLDKKHTDQEMEDEFNNSEDYQFFAGGYAIKNGQKVETLAPTAGTTFQGVAHGRIYSSIQTKGTTGENRDTYLAQYGVEKDKDTNGDQVMDGYSNDAGHDMAQNFITSNATLTFDGTTETLSMPFSSEGFYDVVVTRTNNDDSTVAMQFNNGTNVAQKFQKDATPDRVETAVKLGYYGLENPTEAAGVMQYRTEKDLVGGENDANHAWREWEFQAAYGMEKQ